MLGPLCGVTGREPTGDQCFVFEFNQVADRAIKLVSVRAPLEVS